VSGHIKYLVLADGFYQTTLRAVEPALVPIISDSLDCYSESWWPAVSMTPNFAKL